MVGVTEKSAPLEVEPIGLPPNESVYQLIVFPLDTATNVELAEEHTVVGLAVTNVGAIANGLTYIKIGVLEALMHPPGFTASA